MSIMSKLFLIDCSKAAECCNKVQYKEAKTMEKLKLKFHILFCKACKKFTVRNSKLTEVVEKANIQTCTEDQKKAWKETLDREYAKHNV